MAESHLVHYFWPEDATAGVEYLPEQPNEPSNLDITWCLSEWRAYESLSWRVEATVKVEMVNIVMCLLGVP